MRVPKIPLAQTLIQLCKAKGIQHIVISPGSRNAPLTIGFTNHDYFKCYSVVDERCAAFFGLGIAQKLQEPVALVCTSGSALLNYFPAIAEAYYSQIPLVVISADRPKHLINIGDGQTINQEGVFQNHILDAANLKEDDVQNAAVIEEILQLAITNNGPVHINVPFNEPLYELLDDFTEFPESDIAPKNTEVSEDISNFKRMWEASQKKMILVGVNQPNTVEQQFLDAFANDDSVIVFTETTSNIHHDAFFPSIDKIIAPLSEEQFKELKPDILLTFGGMIVSKKIKAFLRQYQPEQHWHIDPTRAFDTFFCLNKHFKYSVNSFFKVFCTDYNSVNSSYKPFWKDIKTYRSEKHLEYLSDIPFTDLKVFEHILKTVPKESNLQLGNSSTVRYAQLFNLDTTLKVFCNRGTSGIDGSTSTAVGMASVSEDQTVFITGDLSFFYDSNALWNDHIPDNFRIILINNGGGGIFRILPGHKNTENFDQFFETKHQLNAKHLCAMYGFDYNLVDSEEALSKALDTFYKHSERPKLLEVYTPRTRNDEILLNYFKAIS